MITRQQLEIINRKSLKYPLHIAEKDYFLALVLEIVTRSKFGKTLIFKGGTALHHCYLEQYRFSEDLDFSSDEVKISLEKVRGIFDGVDFLNIKKDYVSDATIKLEKLQYIGPLVQPNSLKVEIDYLQNVLLPPQVLKYKNVWGLNFSVSVMDIREICAEKVRAMSDRARYRDFYDFYLILDFYKINVEEVIALLKQKEVRQPITKRSIIQNLEIILDQKETEIEQIYYLRKVENSDIRKMINDLPLTEII